MDFCVTKSSEGLVTPSAPTPSGILNLSRIDSLPALRCNARTLHVFKASSSSRSVITKTIRDALSKALVPYYPLAGRLITSASTHLLQVECSGQGVWFVEASANCTLEQVGYFEDVTCIPFHKLLPHHQPIHTTSSTHDHPIDPLVLMQVTEFEGGGFVMGLTFCHSICDGLGAAQFLNAMGEFARGLPSLTTPPVWQRDFLPPLHHHDHDHDQNLSPMPMPPNMNYELEQANIDIPLDSINQLKTKLGDSQMLLSRSSTPPSAFEVVAASLWSHRTRAIYHHEKNISAHDHQEVKLVFFANCRELVTPPLPKGFYGNCFFPVTVTARIGALIDAPISNVIKLIQEAKSRLPLEFGRWMNGNDQEGGGGGDPFAPPLAYSTLFVSEWGRLGFNGVDYGEGPPRQVVPVQGSSIIPVAIVGRLPYPQKGIRLMTWCVDKAHLQPLISSFSIN